MDGPYIAILAPVNDIIRYGYVVGMALNAKCKWHGLSEVYPSSDFSVLIGSHASTATNDSAVKANKVMS